MSTSVVGVVWIAEQNGLGLPSRYAEPLGDSTVFDQTALKLRRCTGVDKWVVLVSDEGIAQQVKSTVSEWAELEVATQPLPPWMQIVRQARKWSLQGWRGGLNHASVLDEEFHAAEFAQIAKKHEASWLLHVRAESPLVDPIILDEIVERTTSFPEAPLVTGSFPPGLGGCVFNTNFLQELADKNVFPGTVLGYRPWERSVELPEQPFAYKTTAEISRIPYRLLADNDRSLSTIRRIFEADAQASPLQIARLLEKNPEWARASLPAEIEIEICTDRDVRTAYLPKVDRGPMNRAVFEAICADYGQSAELGLVTLGGHGDPMLHPQWAEYLDAAKKLGVYGLSLLTDGTRLDAQTIDILLKGPLDVLCVRLDAANRGSYQKRHGSDSFDKIVNGIHLYLSKREEAGGLGPRIVTRMVRSKETLGEMDEFFDHWMTHADGAVIEGWPDYAGQLPSDRVLNLCPPVRRPCQRLWNRFCVHADGQAVTCSEDFMGLQAAGSAIATSVADHWSQTQHRWQELHRAQRWDAFPLCPSCTQWHRP